MTMQIRELNIRFLCPAFLGDAQQNAAWRTPPFKAQLRQWWRVAMAGQRAGQMAGLDHIREQEAELFGSAAGEGGCRSRVRLRLSSWRAGRLTSWASQGGSRRLAVGDGKSTISADLYLGFGPIESRGGRDPKLRNECAIDAGESADLRVAWPKEARGAERMEDALALMNRLGAVGGRSRNGWGSYVLDGGAVVDLTRFRVSWETAVDNDSWARGVGFDSQGLLLWRTREHRSWEAVIKALGQIRKNLCGEMRSEADRCLLSYPVTDKRLSRWKDPNRIPNSVRFKIVPAADNQLCGLVFHMPCRPDDALWAELDVSTRRRFPDVWRVVHEILDEDPTLERVSQ